MKKWFTITLALVVCFTISTAPIFAKSGKTDGNKSSKTEQTKKVTHGQNSRVVTSKKTSQETDTKTKTTKESTVQRIHENPTLEDTKRTALDQYNKSGTAQSAQTGEQIKWQSINSGGVQASSTNFSSIGSLGQVAVGKSVSSNYAIEAGFIQNFSPSTCCIGLTGNVDNDPGDNIDIGDITALIDFLFISGTPPDCMEEANCDGDPAGNVDIGDLTALIDFLFISGSPTAPC